VSIEWITKLYQLNEAGRFHDALTASKRFVAARPKDYALQLQRAKALLFLGQFDEAEKHLEQAIACSKGLAAWPWFYRAALHARLGEQTAMFAAMDACLRISPKIAPEFLRSPFFAGHWTSDRFQMRLKSVERTAPPQTRHSLESAPRR
jgi:tetratricopeptide (TPR) repeat protein